MTHSAAWNFAIYIDGNLGIIFWFFVLFHWYDPRLSQDDQAYLNTTLSVLNEAQPRGVARTYMPIESFMFTVQMAET